MSRSNPNPVVQSVADYCKTLYLKGAVESSTFVKDLPRNRATVGGQDFYQYLASFRASALEALMQDTLRQNLATLSQSLLDSNALETSQLAQRDEEARTVIEKTIAKKALLCEKLARWDDSSLEDKEAAAFALFEKGIIDNDRMKVFQDACIHSWIASSLGITADDPNIAAMIASWNQVLPHSGVFTEQKVTPKFHVVLAGLDGGISSSNYQAAYKRDAPGHVVLSIEAFPTLSSTTLNRRLSLGKMVYEYKLNLDSDPPSFILLDFKCDNPDYMELLNPTISEEERHAAAGKVLTSLLTEGLVLKDSDKKDIVQRAGDRVNAIRAWITAADELQIFRNLRGFNFKGLSLKGLDLRYADLSEVDLTEVDLTGANLTGANLTGANLRGANLTGANLTGATLNWMIIDASTIFKDVVDADSKIVCDSFTFIAGEEIDPKIMSVGEPGRPDFLQDFLSEYDPTTKAEAHSGFFTRAKTTPMAKALQNDDISPGSKIIKVLSHAQDKMRFGGQNDTKKALDRVLSLSTQGTPSPDSSG